MKTLHSTIFIATLFITFCQAQNSEHYQLKIYSFETDAQMADTDTYLKNNLIPLLKESGIESIGVFKPRKKDVSKPNSTYVLIPFNSLREFTLLNNKYVEERRNINNNVSYLNTSKTKTSFDKIESVMIKADLQLPLTKNQEGRYKKEDRVYELITYKATEQNLLEKDKNGIVANQKSKLRNDKSLNQIFYGEVLSDQVAENLVYMTSYDYNEIIEPVAIKKERVSQKTWKKKKREQKKNLKRKMKQSYSYIEKPKTGPNSKKAINRPPNGVTNLLFATEYSDF